MGPPERDQRYDEIKRCLAEADRAFIRAGAAEDERERIALIDEAETWLMRAERRLARITDRQVPLQPSDAIPRESRSFGGDHSPRFAALWRRIPKA